MTPKQARDWSVRHADEMERQRKDAERYRWLRVHEPKLDEEYAGMPKVGEIDILFIGTGFGSSQEISGKDLDAAIDKAMK